MKKSKSYISFNCILSFSELNFCFECPSEDWKIFIEKHYRGFLTQDSNRFLSNIRINPELKSISEEVEVRRIRNGWEISRSDFYSFSPFNFQNSVLSVKKNKYSFDSWLRVYFTLIGLKFNSILLHSAGYFMDNNAYLFPGRSGRGKSTITRILEKDNALSDELVILKCLSKEVCAFSSPFWGELSRGRNTNFKAPLKGLYFIRHGKDLKAKTITPQKALIELLATILFFSKNSVNVEKVLKLASFIVQKVPAYELSFTLNNSRTDILNILKNNRSSFL